MFNKTFVFTFLLTTTTGIFFKAHAQVLTLKDAVAAALANYGTVKAKANYINAAQALVKESKNEQLPDFNVSAQQDYGTVNGENGPVYGYRGLSTAASGPVLASNNWNSAFGALYLANINWDFYSFGKAREKVKVQQSSLALNQSDLAQEKFELQVKVSGAYLNLLAAQRLTKSAQDNLYRTEALRDVVVPRVKNGLNAGVDSSLANAEVSNAKIAVLRAKDYEDEQANQLAILMGTPTQQHEFTLDSFFVQRLPQGAQTGQQVNIQAHPLLQYYQSRINLSNQQAKYIHTFNYPTFSVFGLFQGRGTGFDYNYGVNNPAGYTHNYFTGINPTGTNYLFGIGAIWNLTSPLRVQQQVIAQQYTSRGLKDEYDLVNEQLQNQYTLAESKMRNAVAAFAEAPVQVKAASDAYMQKTVLYKNGLSNIVDVTQTLFQLNLAETDRDISENNVWQALLLKAAASGDFGMFINEF